MSVAIPEKRRMLEGALAPMIIGCALFMQTLDSTIISNALPTMARSLHEDPVTLNLAITAYLLAAAVFLPISGWAADRFGAKQHLPHRHRHLRPQFALLRPGAEPARAGGRAHGPGGGRGDDGAGRAAGAAAVRAQVRTGAGHVLPDHAGHAGPGAGPAGRRLHRHLFLLALDLLHQRADRDPGRGAGLASSSRTCARKPP